MEDFFLEPLEYAVFRIIAGSHLDNNPYAFVPVRNLDKIALISDPKFPYITCKSSLGTITNDEVEATLSIVITIPFPDQLPDELESMRYLKAMHHAQSHQRDLFEIMQWLTGRKKLADGNPMFDFDMVQADMRMPDYDPVLDKETEAKRVGPRIINVGIDMIFKGYHDDLCCNRFNPSETVPNWRDVLAQF